MPAALLELLSHLTPAERRILVFLVGWGAFGAAGFFVPWSAGFSSDGAARTTIPSDDPRAALHARSAALAAHLALARTPPEQPLDPNHAPREALDRLPGVGPKTAQRWVQERRTGGPFFALPDLGRISGLGPKRLAKLASHLTFERQRPESPPAVPPDAVDLNRASAEELLALPGVGPVLARRIVAYRSVHGPFGAPEDLDEVPGIGPAMLHRLAKRVRLDEFATPCGRMRQGADHPRFHSHDEARWPMPNHVPIPDTTAGTASCAAR